MTDECPIAGYSREHPSSERPDSINELRAEVRGIRWRPARKKAGERAPHDPVALHSLFTVCTGNRWIELGERLPAQKQLFGPFWHQRELCIMFAAANTGKSILAMQIADALSRGRSAAPFAPRLKPQRVLYIDFELSTAQFSQRYGQPGQPYNFSETFFRAEFNADPQLCPENARYDDFVFDAIEYKIQLVKPSVLIIDNITCLSAGIESAAVALRVLKSLKQLQARYNLSVLALAHTPKRNGKARPISADDLYGSKLLINFADSAFAIGASGKSRGLCYLKQIKQRNTGQVYHAGNVCLCRIINHKGFLKFKFKGHDDEVAHLDDHAADRLSLRQKAAALAGDRFSQRKIAKKLHISLGLVNKLLREARLIDIKVVCEPKPATPSKQIRLTVRIKPKIPILKPVQYPAAGHQHIRSGAVEVLAFINGP